MQSCRRIIDLAINRVILRALSLRLGKRFPSNKIEFNAESIQLLHYMGANVLAKTLNSMRFRIKQWKTMQITCQVMASTNKIVTCTSCMAL